jgi:hypothetical protein
LEHEPRRPFARRRQARLLPKAEGFLKKSHHTDEKKLAVARALTRQLGLQVFDLTESLTSPGKKTTASRGRQGRRGNTSDNLAELVTGRSRAYKEWIRSGGEPPRPPASTGRKAWASRMPEMARCARRERASNDKWLPGCCCALAWHLLCFCVVLCSADVGPKPPYELRAFFLKSRLYEHYCCLPHFAGSYSTSLNSSATSSRSVSVRSVQSPGQLRLD